MSEYLYCARYAYGDLRIAKIGTTGKPRDRMQAITQNSPFPLAGITLKRFNSRKEANAWETHLIGAATRYRSGSEWVVDDEVLADLWQGVIGGEDVSVDATYAGRVVPDRAPAETRAAAFAEMFRSRVGHPTAQAVGYHGDPEEYDRALIKARLIQGYGVEDIAVLDDLDQGIIRDEIHRLRAIGQLSALYRQQRGAA